MKRAVVHIGTHKTGTTSIQRFLRDQVGEPSFPPGYFFDDNHGALAHAVARAGRLTTSRDAHDAETQERIADLPAVTRAHIERCDDLIVFSGESLSMLRFSDEVEQVVALFEGCELSIVMYTRRPEDFMRAYRTSMKVWGHQPSDDPDSICYLAEDSWLIDYRARLELWAHYCHVIHVDYDEVVERDGSVIPSFAELIGIEPVEYRLNVTSDNEAWLSSRTRTRSAGDRSD